MEARNNPYSPGAGRIPVALVGRDVQLEEWYTSLLRIEDSLDARPMALYGLRGVGKTVLLLTMHEKSLSRGWISAFVEAVATKSLREQLSTAIESKLVEIAQVNAGGSILKALKTALSFSATVSVMPSMSFGLDLSKVNASNAGTGNISGDLERLITDLSDAAAELDVGLSILVDEAQELCKEDMLALVKAAQMVVARKLHVTIVLAGLPTLPRLLADARSYAERQFSYHQISNLSSEEAARALLEPAKCKGVDWDKAATDTIVEITDGYPFFLQEYGSACWLLAEESPISLDITEQACFYATEQLDKGFFLSRWERTTAAEKRYLRAMAEDNDHDCLTKDLSKRLGAKSSTLSSLRSRLIQKGIIYAPEIGKVAFTIPLMSQFIKRQID